MPWGAVLRGVVSYRLPPENKACTHLGMRAPTCCAGVVDYGGHKTRRFVGTLEGGLTGLVALSISDSFWATPDEECHSRPICALRLLSLQPCGLARERLLFPGFRPRFWGANACCSPFNRCFR